MKYITPGGHNAKRGSPPYHRALRILLPVLALSLWLSLAPGRVARADDLTPGYWERTPLPQTGLATFYAPGLMEYVDGYRSGLNQLPDCPECVGRVALLRAGDIGRKVWLQPPGGEPVGPFLVVDCARRQDVAPLVARDWAVDVSYELGQLWGMTRPLAGVTVLEDPADNSPVRRTSGVPTPFFVPPGQVIISAPTATPARPSAAPTAWPTRLPVARFPVLVEPAPAAQPPRSAAPLMPPPLTPIVTTPTPPVTPPADGLVAGILPLPTATVAPDAAVGRPGAALLGAAPALVTPQVQPAWSGPVVTPRPPARTPRPNLTPILPSSAPAAPQPDAPLAWLWRSILGFILR